MNLNIGCGTHRAGTGWVNIDPHVDEAAGIVPDVVATLDDLPYGDGTVRRLYAGHCLEHIPLGDKFTAAMVEVRRVLDPAGVACFVCPDVYKAIQGYRDGHYDWTLVDACLEGPDSGIDPASAWDGCFHAWNCHEARLLREVATVFPDAVAVPMDSPSLAPFPIVSRVEWQCAVLTRVTP